MKQIYSLALSLTIVVSLFGPVKAQTATPPTYPRMVGYLGVLHPLVTFDGNGSETNFNTYYVVGFPIGLNLWKTKQIGFSVEVVPIIRAENGTSRVANVLFHPGVLVNLGHDFTLASRLAFETSGRYGFTPVLNKIVKKGPTISYFVAVPIPVRFGNDRPTTLTAGLQFGIVFLTEGHSRIPKLFYQFHETTQFYPVSGSGQYHPPLWVA